MGARGPKPRARVDTTWRPELAYALGLIVADGSLSSNGRHINFTSKDISLIKTYQSCLKLENIKIGGKCSGYNENGTYYQIQFGDVLFYKWLVTIGLTPNKTRTVAKIAVPNEYFFDFVRGEWDGDGTIYRSQDKRWRSSYIVSVGFASGSEKFVEWLQGEINKRIDTTGHIVRTTRGLCQLRFAKSDSKKLLEAMFYREGLPHLERKFAKAQKILKIDALNSLNIKN